MGVGGENVIQTAKDRDVCNHSKLEGGFMGCGALHLKQKMSHHHRCQQTKVRWLFFPSEAVQDKLHSPYPAQQRTKTLRRS